MMYKSCLRMRIVRILVKIIHKWILKNYNKIINRKIFLRNKCKKMSYKIRINKKIFKKKKRMKSKINSYNNKINKTKAMNK